MKFVFSLLFLLVITGSLVNAQNGKFSLGLGPAIGNPLNRNYSSLFKNGLGGFLSANYRASRLGYVTAGYTYLVSSSKIAAYRDYHISFLKVGYRTNLSNSNIFLGADAGLASYNSSVFNGGQFVIGAGGGYSFKIDNQNRLEISSTYNMIMPSMVNSSWLLFNIQYRHLFKKN